MSFIFWIRPQILLSYGFRCFLMQDSIRHSQILLATCSHTVWYCSGTSIAAVISLRSKKKLVTSKQFFDSNCYLLRIRRRSFKISVRISFRQDSLNSFSKLCSWRWVGQPSPLRKCMQVRNHNSHLQFQTLAARNSAWSQPRSQSSSQSGTWRMIYRWGFVSSLLQSNYTGCRIFWIWKRRCKKRTREGLGA